MFTLAEQLKQYSYDYVRHGGKTNRKQQLSRILFFLKWINQQKIKVTKLDQLGKKHIISFWKNHRYMSDATAYGYWLAFCLLWEWLNKPELPPKPFKINHEGNGN